MKEIEVLIVGAGGSGQSYFMKQIGQHFSTNSVGDNDKLKHMARPNMELLKQYNIHKCIFLYNRSFEGICSFYRRNPSWPWIQTMKLGNSGKLTAKDFGSIDRFFSLVEQRNEDLFSIRYQFENWVNADLPFPIYFVDFNNIDVDRLSAFLGCEKNLLNFNVKPRREYPQIRDKYPKAYELYQKLDKQKEELATAANKR